MSPTDFLLLFASLLLAGMSIAANGWTVNGLSPAILSTTDGLWQLWMQWLRHRSWLRR